MNTFLKDPIEVKAKAILKAASSIHGIKASLELTDNYHRIWTRDSAVAALTILSYQMVELYDPIKSAIELLFDSAGVSGQIPSNISVDISGKMTAVSFGGPVGRTDTGFWWIIMALQYLSKQPDDHLKARVYAQANKIFKIVDVWEFNDKNLMYVPMGSNWADEYITHGYVLYDQILRYWALHLAGSFYNRTDWSEKASAVKLAIKQHYLLEGNLNNSLYTEAQKKELLKFDLTHQFIASFSPGDRIERFDAWSVGLLLLLNIPSKESAKKLEQATLQIFDASNQKGIPAFYPLIQIDDPLFHFIKLNHSYHFKNFPGHFHNGGIWPVTNGFLVAGLNQNGFHQTAKLLQKAMNQNLAQHQHSFPFAEYFDFEKAIPGGVKNMCYSASGYLLGKIGLTAIHDLNQQLFSIQQKEVSLNMLIKENVNKIIEEINGKKNEKTAISIAGESGCGKTTLSKAIKERLLESGKKVIILHQDDYFKLPPKQNHEARLKDFENIGPEEVRLSLIDEHILKIKQGATQVLSIPHMDWINDQEETFDINVREIDLIIIEGTYTSLLTAVDKHIFINTNYQSTKENRVIRNREVVTDFIESVLQKESNIISSHQSMAHIILDSAFNLIYKKHEKP